MAFYSGVEGKAHKYKKNHYVFQIKIIFGKCPHDKRDFERIIFNFMVDIFSQSESNVRIYSRLFPALFCKAKDAYQYDNNGKIFLDFVSGAGALNYGHNNEHLKKKLLAYIQADGVTHSLDMHTSAKKDFLDLFNKVILEPRNLSYKIQFTGPTGTNAVEAALKLARKVTGKKNILYFSNSFHGMTLGAMSVSANLNNKQRAGIELTDTTVIPYCGENNSLELLQQYTNKDRASSDYPAAIILETIQAEGGINIANSKWLQTVAELAKKANIILIVDEIQVGCGRTGQFFSFEDSAIYPDIICLSKSLSGYGLPMSVNLIKPEYDLWTPGEHSGTFRGNNHAFVTAAAALEYYWLDLEFAKSLQAHAEQFKAGLEALIKKLKPLCKKASLRGCGFIYGIDLKQDTLALKVREAAFSKGLIIETCGKNDSVIKLMPPLTIDINDLTDGLTILEQAFLETLSQ